MPLGSILTPGLHQSDNYQGIMTILGQRTDQLSQTVAAGPMPHLLERVCHIANRHAYEASCFQIRNFLMSAKDGLITWTVSGAHQKAAHLCR